MVGVVGMVGKTASMDKPERKTSTEMTMRGTEISSGRVGIEYFQEICHVLRILGAEANTPTKNYGDNKSAQESCANKNAECKSRH